jgi:hypothetical protein
MSGNDIIREWAKLSDSGLRLRCGEITAQEIRTVRAVLAAMIRSIEERDER